MLYWTLPGTLAQGHLEINTNAVVLLRLRYTAQVVSLLGFPLTKLSLCFFYIRVFWSEIPIRWSLISCAIFITVYTIAVEIASGFVTHYAFTSYALYGRMARPISLLYGVCNCVSDGWIILSVAPRVFKLRVHPRKKAAILSVFFIGWIVVAASIARFVWSDRAYNYGNRPWLIWRIHYVTALEMNAAIFCAAAPGLLPLARKLAPSFMRTVDSVSPADGDAVPPFNAPAAPHVHRGLVSRIQTDLVETIHDEERDSYSPNEKTPSFKSTRDGIKDDSNSSESGSLRGSSNSAPSKTNKHGYRGSKSTSSVSISEKGVSPV